jgi:DNA-binding protein Fis
LRKRSPRLQEQERDYIGQVLEETAGNQTAAAQILGINRASLWRKLKGRREE